MIALSYWSIIIYDMEILVNSLEKYWRVLVYTSISSIFYVLLGFDLYDRVNTFIDKKFVKTKRKKVNLNEPDK